MGLALATPDEPGPSEPAQAVADDDEPSPADAAREVAAYRERLLALEELRFQKGRKAATGQFIVSGIELGVGGLALAGSDPDAGLQAGFGTALIVGGVVHGLQSWAQVDFSGRRHAMFGRRVVEIDGEPLQTMLELGDDHALLLERSARANSFATGLNIGLLGAGVITAVLAPDQQGEDLGAGLAVVGFTGAIHHAFRWRTAVRIGTDLRVLRRRVP